LLREEQEVPRGIFSFRGEKIARKKLHFLRDRQRSRLEGQTGRHPERGNAEPEDPKPLRLMRMDIVRSPSSKSARGMF
jgi:hypothetical protein